MTLVLLFSACQKTEDLSDKFMKTEDFIRAFYDDDEIRKMCSVNTSNAMDKANKSIVHEDTTTTETGTTYQIAPKKYKTLAEFYKDYAYVFDLPVFSPTKGGNQILGLPSPYNLNTPVNFSDVEFQAGDIILDLKPIYGLPERFNYGNAVDAGINIGSLFLQGISSTLVGVASTANSIIKDFVPSGKSTPEEATLADFGIQGYEGIMQVIIGDVARNEHGQLTATIMYIDFSYDGKNNVSNISARVMDKNTTTDFPKLPYIFQKGAIIPSLSKFNVPSIDDRQSKYLGVYHLSRHPTKSWVQKSGVCKLCTQQSFCTNSWQNCMAKNSLINSGYALIEDFVDGNICEKRCDNPALSCVAKKNCLTQYSRDPEAAKKLECDDKNLFDFCDIYPDAPECINTKDSVDDSVAPITGGGSLPGSVGSINPPSSLDTNFSWNLVGGGGSNCTTMCDPETPVIEIGDPVVTRVGGLHATRSSIRTLKDNRSVKEASYENCTKICDGQAVASWRQKTTP